MNGIHVHRGTGHILSTTLNCHSDKQAICFKYINFAVQNFIPTFAEISFAQGTVIIKAGGKSYEMLVRQAKDI